MEPTLHQRTKAQLKLLDQARTGSFCFSGPHRTGKFATALWLARRATCAQNTGTDNCAQCKLVAAGSHPDVLVVAPLEGKAGIGIEQIQTLQQALKLSHQLSPRRYVLINQADSMTTEAQNSLLKVLEEPPRATTIILIATQPEQLLPTVRSRCQEINFTPTELPALDAAAQQIVEQLDQLSLLNKLQLAAKLADSDQREAFIAALGQQLRRNLRAAAQHSNRNLVKRVRHQLAAVERLQLQLAANVNSRLALEGLVLEL